MFLGKYLKIIVIIENLLLTILFNIVIVIGNLKISKISVPGLNIIIWIIYYIFIIIFIYIKNNPLNNLFIKNKIKSILIITRKHLILIGLILLVFLIIDLFCPKDYLKIYFIDVDQGDCSFIITPQNKTILIDGGNNENYDYGKNVVVPFILKSGIGKVDYIIISHFDSDHVGGLFAVMEDLNVGRVIISAQGESSENFETFNDIVKENKIQVIVAKKGDRIQIENDLYVDVLWPNASKLISENVLNNNSIVCKLHYKSFSMLFTGDIEEIAERQILAEYRNNMQILDSTILKVGHHGSKTSSTQEFVNIVKPKIALIGVGKNNKFGHPNMEILERLKNSGSKIYRTDKFGEISVIVDSKGRIKIEKFVQWISFDNK